MPTKFYISPATGLHPANKMPLFGVLKPLCCAFAKILTFTPPEKRCLNLDFRLIFLIAVIKNHINHCNHSKITVQTLNLNLLGFENLTGLGRVRLIAPLHRNPRLFHRHCGELKIGVSQSRNPLTQKVILNSILTVEDNGFQSKTSKQSFENQSSDTNFYFYVIKKYFFEERGKNNSPPRSNRSFEQRDGTNIQLHRCKRCDGDLPS
jgi:hypothetical protein